MPIRDRAPFDDRSPTVQDSTVSTQKLRAEGSGSDETTPFRRDRVQREDPTVHVSLPALANDDFASRYEQRSVLGEGGMGQVRLCGDKRIGRDVAVKVIRESAEVRSDLRVRFEREARIQGQLEHPSIVPVYDMGVGDDGAFFSMRRVNGHTLEFLVDRLSSGDPEFTERYTTRKLVAAFNQLALAVAFAHSRGVVHRDLKPANVMLGDFGEVYLLDWGLAKLITEPDPYAPAPTGTTTLVDGQTAMGIVMGTPGYMSPEQVRGLTDALDARTDIYALGAILFELLCHSPLHPSSPVARTVTSTLSGPDARPSMRSPSLGISPVLDAVCVKATSLSPEDRYASARDMVVDLEQFLEGDRDVARKLELAAQHVSLAENAANRAGSTTGNEALAARAEAIREANRALALDPSRTDAVQLLAWLLLHSTGDLPPEAASELARSEDAERRTTGRVGAVSFLTWYLLAPLLVLIGVRSYATLALTAALTACSSAISWWLAVRKSPVTNLGAFVLLVTSSTAIALLSSYLGPFVIVPAIAAQNTLIFAMYAPRGRWRIATTAVGVLSTVVPLGLELLGALPASFAFRNGAFVLLPRMAELPEIPTLCLLVLSSCVSVIVPSVVVSRIHDDTRAAKHRVFTYLWHLDQLVPAGARRSRRTATRSG